MKRIAVALLLLLSLTPFAHADDATKRTKVEELFTLLHIDQTSTQIMANINRQMQGLSTHQFGATPTPDQQKQFSDLQTRVTNVVQQTIGWKVIEPDFIKLYTDAYTEPEIDSILAFYRSPAGQAMLTKSPELSSKSLAITQQRMTPVEPQLRQMVADFIKQTTPASPAPPSLNSLPPSNSVPPATSTPPSSSTTPKP